MSKKNSDFFTKNSIKIEASEVEPKVISSNINDNISVKLETEENSPNLGENSAQKSQNLPLNNNPGPENETRINKNVKSEPEKQLLLILPQQKIHKFPVPIKTEAKVKDVLCEICKRTLSSLGHLKEHQKVHEVEHKCKYCSKIFHKNSIMLKHIKSVHENPGNIKCDICEVIFSTQSSLNRHQKNHIKNRPKPFKCNKCDYATDRNSSLKGHLKAHEKGKCDKCNTNLHKNRIHDCRLDCKFCGLKFSQAGHVTQHIKKHHGHEIGRSLYECDICGLKCYVLNNLRIHMEAKHADGKIQAFTCDLDGKAFKCKENIARHMKSHLQPVKCDFCHIKVNKGYLKRHIINFHTGIKQPRKKYIPKTKSFTCPMCFKVFSTKTVLKKHISDHNKIVKCKFCEKLFGCQSSLKTHIRDYHENPEGYICNICGKKCTQRSCLKVHMKTHDPNRARDLKCSQCDFATDNKKSFQSHLNFHKRRNAKIAAMNNPHKCTKCPAVLKSRKAWNSHMFTAHPKNLFECDICGKKIKTKHGMMTHFKGFHKVRSTM